MADIEYTVGETAITVSFLGPQGPGVPTGGTAGQALVKSSSDDYDTEWSASAAPVDSVNGEIGAVVLDAADVGAAAASHSHTLSDVTDSGGAAALEVGTTAGTVAAGDHTHTGVYATAAQGALADSATQPGDLATVATTGAYSDLSGTPTLGTAAAAATGDFATAAQGTTADSATQPGDDAATLGSGASADGQVLTSDGAGNAAWETPASGVTDHGLLTGLADDDHAQYHTDARGDARYTQRSNNLSDLASASIARTNLGLGTAATSATGDFATAAHTHSLLPALTVNAQTGTTYTLVLADAGKLVTLSNAAAITATVPPNSSVAFPIGTRIALLQLGAGQVTVAQGSGVTVNTAETLKLNDQYAAAELLKTATDTWVLFGRLEAA